MGAKCMVTGDFTDSSKAAINEKNMDGSLIKKHLIAG